MELGVLCCDKGSEFELALGEITKCYGCHALTQAEIDVGVVLDTAMAIGTMSGSNRTVTASHVHNITLSSKSCIRISMVKHLEVDSSLRTIIGDSEDFAFYIENNCPMTLMSVELIGSPPLTDVFCIKARTTDFILGNTTLKPHDSIRCRGTHAITEEDIEAMAVNQTMTARGTTGTGSTVTHTFVSSHELIAGWKQDFDPWEAAYNPAIEDDKGRFCGANRECYAALGLPPFADIKTVGRAFRRLSVIWHHDKLCAGNPGCDRSIQVFLVRAKNVLVEPSLKQAYDEKYRAALDSAALARKSNRSQEVSDAHSDLIERTLRKYEELEKGVRREGKNFKQQSRAQY